jgi:hypothetical protein
VVAGTPVVVACAAVVRLVSAEVLQARRFEAVALTGAAE